MSEDFQTRIEATERGRVVFVDKYDDNEVWLSIQTSGGSANCIIDYEQAQRMIEALGRIIKQEVSA